MFFKCKHPAKSLVVEKESTYATKDEDFDYVSYHLMCTKCKELVTITHARLIGGIEAFVSRARK